MGDYVIELNRIAEALEGILGELKKKERKKVPIPKMNIRNTGGDPNAGFLITAYCDAFKARYGTRPPIDGKTAGLAQQILKAMPLEFARSLVQAYVQMDDKWFLEKCHDFATLAQNLNKVAVSLANGTQNPHERKYWAEVFGGQNGSGSLPNAGQEAPKQLGGASVQGRASEPVLEGF